MRVLLPALFCVIAAVALLAACWPRGAPNAAWIDESIGVATVAWARQSNVPHLVAASNGGRVNLLDLPEFDRIWSCDTGSGFASMRVAEDGVAICVARWDGTSEFMSGFDCTSRGSIELSGYPDYRGLTVDQKCDHVVGIRDGVAFVRSSRAGRVISELVAPDADANGSNYRALVISPDGRRVAGLVGSGLHVWDAICGALLYSSAHEGNPILVIAFTGSKYDLVYGDSQGSVAVIDEAGAEAPVWQARRGDRIVDVAVAPDSQSVAIATISGDVVVVDMEAGAVQANVAIKQGYRVSDVAFSPDGARLAISAFYPREHWPRPKAQIMLVDVPPGG